MKRKNPLWQRSLSLLLCLVMVLGLLPVLAVAETITAPIKTSNISDLNYTYDRWANPIKSYLFSNGDGTFTRVEYTGAEVTVERYDSSFQFVSGSTVAMELPLFGGFHQNADSYFLVFGQTNPNEDDTVEVVRVVRYTKEWRRVGAASLYGANTVTPFDGGSLRFAEYNGYLYIRTSHEMYADSNGTNHQANLMMNVRISDMVMTDSYYKVMNSRYGYISHSFNQFIAVADGKLVAVDHGDALPRSVVLTRYLAAAGQDLFIKDPAVVTIDGVLRYKYADTVEVLPIGGSYGNNDTGVALGGFEVSDSHYLIAGNTIDQTVTFDHTGQRNIFISATAKNDFTTDGTELHYLTSYAAGDSVTLDTPCFVKINQNRYLVLWKETVDGTSSMHWAFVDGTGAPTGERYSGGGALSDCQPIVVDGKLIWYVTSNSVPAFMTIDLQNPTEVTHQHIYTYSYAKYPSNISPGSLTSVCAVCGIAGETVTIPAIQGCDEYVLTSTKTEPTCTTEGYGYYTWTKLANYDVSQYTFGGKIPALGHNYQSVTVAATCTTDGKITDTCSRCGDVVTQVLPALGHDSGDVEVLPPTCTEAGGSNFTCVICGKYISETVPPTGHYYDKGVVTEPACDQAGYTTYTCTVCGDSYQDDYVDGPGHTWFTNSMSATCTVNGYTKYKCTVCGYNYQETIPATGHNYVTTVTPPTCTEVGYTTYDCANTYCSSVYTADDVPALGHSYQTVTVAATCTTAGSITTTCSACGDSTVETIPALGHSYADGVCAVCGEKEAGPQGQCGDALYWSIDENKTLTIYGTGAMWNYDASTNPAPWTEYSFTALVVEPGATSVGNYAFYQCEDLGEVTLSEGVTTIGDYCFKECIWLMELELPESLDVIGSSAFSDCRALIELDLPETMTSIGNWAFELTGINSVTIPLGITELSYGLFACCEMLQTVTIPEEVVSIGDYCFAHCYALKQVELPESVTSIGDCAFADCGGLEEITIPSAVTRIGESTFWNCSALTTVSLPDGLTVIAEYAFSDCTALQQIRIPAAVTTIGDYAFLGCTTLDYIDFYGNAPQIGDMAFSNVVATAVYFSHITTWTQDVMLDYGGSITWSSKIMTVPTLELKYPSLTFEDVITMNVFFQPGNTADVVQMGLITYKTQVDQWNVDNAEAVIPGYKWNEAAKLYEVSTGSIPAKDMGDIYWFAVYAKLKDGSYTYSRLVSYSPMTYAYNQLGDPDMADLVIAMLNYGAAAQTYFGYRTDSLMNQNLTDAQKASIESYRADMMDGISTPSATKAANFAKTAAGFTRRYPTITFEGAFSIDYFCQPSAAVKGDITLYYWNQTDYDAASVLTKGNATGALRLEKNGDLYSTAVKGIAAKDLDKGVYVAFVYSDGTNTYCSGILGYSIGVYCQSLASGGDAMAPFAAATAVYGYYAKQTFGN